MEGELLHLLSCRINSALDVAGASEYIRRTRQHNALVQDVLTTLAFKFEGISCVSVYTFGSYSEGTTTPGILSDEDILMCFQSIPVYAEEADVNSEDFFREIDTSEGENCCDRYLLMICDRETPAGFTKLKFVCRDKEMIYKNKVLSIITTDINGVDVLVNNKMLEAMTHDEQNGPAATTLAKPGFTDLDYIPAFRCKKWPSMVQEFLTRKRDYDFPSNDVIGDFGTLGVFLVPTGQADSPERHLQWRISFSMQERKIMMNLNETQFKCYVLLKMVKKDYVKHVIPEKSLTSYHCKTSLFFLIEETGNTSWTRENLVGYFVRCLQLLRSWVSVSFIPSYFMPKVNLWKGSLTLRDSVVAILDKILKDVPGALYGIQCDRVGEILQDSVDDIPRLSHTNHDTEDENSGNCLMSSSRDLYRALYRLHHNFSGTVVEVVNDLLLHSMNKDDLDQSFRSHKRLVQLLENTKKLSEFTSQDIEGAENAASLVLPFIYTSLGSQIATKAIQKQDLILEQEAIDFLKKGQHSDFLAGRVKFAAVLYAQQKYSECLKLLMDLDNCLGDGRDFITVGKKSKEYSYKMLLNEALLQKMLSVRPTSHDILKNNVATSVIFLPTEIPLIPKDLQYELFRSFGLDINELPAVCDWYQIVAVDSKILLFYLLYQVHEKLGNDKGIHEAFIFMNEILETDFNLCHMDTAWNLIGCILRDKRRLRAALRSFHESWQKRPNHNAAKWHALITCFEVHTIFIENGEESETEPDKNRIDNSTNSVPEK